MKSIFLTLFLFFSIVGFSQNVVVKRDLVTSSYSTSTMKWNYYSDKWDFENNNDEITQRTGWEITLWDNERGFVNSGSIRYTVKKWFYDEQGEYPMIFMEVFNHTLSRDLEMMLMKVDDKIFLSVFDSQNKLVHYFAE
jgi:hypothetical protein